MTLNYHQKIILTLFVFALSLTASALDNNYIGRIPQPCNCGIGEISNGLLLKSKRLMLGAPLTEAQTYFQMKPNQQSVVWGDSTGVGVSWGNIDLDGKVKFRSEGDVFEVIADTVTFYSVDPNTGITVNSGIGEVTTPLGTSNGAYVLSSNDSITWGVTITQKFGLQVAMLFVYNRNNGENQVVQVNPNNAAMRSISPTGQESQVRVKGDTGITLMFGALGNFTFPRGVPSAAGQTIVSDGQGGSRWQ